MIVAHDLGTTGNKASLHTDDGRTLATFTAEYPTQFGAHGVAEQDPEQWWQAVGAATRGLLEQVGVAASEVRGIGLSGQMMGAVFLDGQHRPTRPAIIWADSRSQEQAARLLDAVGQETAYAELGHRIHPTYTLAKMMWVRENEPQVWARTRHVCVAKDIVAYRMTGILVTDPSDASGTNAFDQRTGDWSERMLAAAGIDAAVLPPIVPSTSVVGGLTPEAAAATGLPVDTPVVLGGGDGPMAAVGAGVTAAEDSAYACLGSSSWISCAAIAPLHDPQLRSMTFNHVVPGHFVPTATMQAGGASLSWVMELFGGGEDDYGRLLAEATAVAAADEGLFFLPYLLGERSPNWNANAAGTFAGLQRHHGPAHLVRAVLEGVAFNLRTCMGAFTDSGIPLEHIDAIGGGAQSEAWLQVLADVWQIPVRQRTIVADANSLGAAVTAAVGLGLVQDFEVAKNLSSISAELTPDTSRADRAAAQHEIFLAAYDRLEQWFDTRRVSA
ncbi:xylulokinase [Ornithinimicrobium sediminis]|uniref:xylulokinase n=1 Tax=Ornithinimicrobium sediminis TaxID=2904603 RepID=UPI001E55D87A|nr:xylulokinase [Ornithinimicrobium sediminis]MCE0487385.1 xylulokinase [Ornithinimicrobium sediminis]